MLSAGEVTDKVIKLNILFYVHLLKNDINNVPVTVTAIIHSR